MPINPVTLDKIDYNVIKQIETKVVDRIVHETKGAELQREQNNNKFDLNRQKKAIEDFAKFLTRFGLKFEGNIINKKVKIKIINLKGETLVEAYIDDLESLFNNIKDTTGSFIDIRG